MYAIVETGGKQYRAEVGQTLEVEKLPAAEGDTIEFDRVLLLSGDEGVKVGQPTVDGAVVKGQVTGQVKGKKVVVFKMKRRKGYRRRKGHRQQYTHVKITGIEG